MALDPKLAAAYADIIKKAVGWEYEKVETDLTFEAWVNYVNSNYLGGTLVDQYLYQNGYGGAALKAGTSYAYDSAAGAAASDLYTSLLPTDAAYDAATGRMTAQFGNVVNEAGEVTKKGLRLGASTGAKVVGGALAAFGAVATGVNWYRDNPEFWTDVSQKLLPFAYKDPTDKSWGDIFYDAFAPMATDDEGLTYVPADLLQALANAFYNGGLFSAGETTAKVTEKPNDYFNEALLNVDIPIYSNGIFAFKREGAGYLYATFSDDVEVVSAFTGPDPSIDTSWIFGASTKPFLRGSTLDKSDVFNPHVNPKDIDVKSTDVSSLFKVPLYYGGSGQTPSQGHIINMKVPALPVIDSGTIAYIMLYGTITKKDPIDNVSKDPGATYPDGRPLSEIYPEWFKNAQTTVNPNWQPDKPASPDNQKYITWLPLQFPSENTPDGDTEPDTDQDAGQSGKPTPDPSPDPDTDAAINGGVLPDPDPAPDARPSLNPDPQPDPQPDPTPDPTDPSDPTSVPTPTPTPGVPSIGGGSANALWKIYNPSQAILQQFGAWLWSDNPLELIKQIFSNSPAEGVVGLHMIYVKPPIGGTANIKVGYIDSGVASPWVSQQYVSFDCGSVTVPLAYQSALDFGYTKVYCYLPFIGIVPLDSFDIIGKTVSIKYTVDVLTGAVLAQISVSSGSYNAVLYTFNGSCSVEYPLTAGTRASQLLSLVTGAVGGAVVGGVGGAIIGGVRGAATGADVRMSGNLSGNAGAMGIRKPYLIVKRPVEVAARNYNSFYGYPANITGLLSSFSGYTRVKSAHVENITRASDSERDMIMNALRDGVIV